MVETELVWDQERRVTKRVRQELALAPGPVRPMDLWLEVRLADGNWTVAYRIVLTQWGSLPRIGEMRIFPTERGFKSRALGTWSAEYKGIASAVPGRGLSSGLLKEIKISLVSRQLEEAVSLAAVQHPEFVGMWPKYKGALLGQRAPRKEKRSKRGRRPLPSCFLATIAKVYVEALSVEHVEPIPYIAARHPGVKLGTVRTWVLKARDAGFLIGRRERGRAAGTLSPAAEMVLREHGSKGRVKT